MRPLRLGDLPGAAFDVAVDDKFLWVATDAGLVRIRLDASARTSDPHQKIKQHSIFGPEAFSMICCVPGW